MMSEPTRSDEPLETGSAPQPLDFPGAGAEPPGRPDGDADPDEEDREEPPGDGS